MEVEQVGLDGERVGAEGGTVADIGDGLKRLVPHGERGDVDADSRHEFGIRCQIDCGNGVARSIAATRCRGTEDGERLTEKSAGVTDIAG